jgi:hypothetical protein
MDFASLLFPTVLSIPKMIFLITVTLNAIHVSLVTESTIIFIISEIDENSPYVADYILSSGI